MNRMQAAIGWALLGLLPFASFSQKDVTVKGKVLDSKTREPLAYANLIMINETYGTFSNELGEFSWLVPASIMEDSVNISYIGYKSTREKLSVLNEKGQVFLEETPIVLDNVTVPGMKLDMRKLHEIFKLVRGNMYAQRTEVTNGQYNSFLFYLKENHQEKQWGKYNYDLSDYQGSVKTFYVRYHTPTPEKLAKHDKRGRDTDGNYNNYPVINISHEAASMYCKWLTEQYNNSTEKRRFKKVVFRLATLNEWQIAALGDPEFQSWNLDENFVTVPEPTDTLAEAMGKSKKKLVLPVKTEVSYPWWGSYNYRKKAQNRRHCFLGNFKMPANFVPCEIQKPGGDGSTVMGQVASYFPNDMGLFDVVGNVAEMIDEEGKACGGSWDHLPLESTIRSVSRYSKSDDAVGFRVFMEVIEP